MKSYISVVALALLASMPGVIAHIDMQDPPPIRHKNNKFATSIDSDYSAPVKEVCKGYHKLGGADLTPVATWQAGSQQKYTLGGSAVHGGGSCQASISEDGGNTFKVIKSYVGDCPHASGNAGTFDFTVPKETKNGPVLFAWSWFNKVGNREMYMNCASIEITGGGSGLSSYPDILLANIGNGCTTVDNKDVLFPNPGKDVVTAPGADTAPPTGNCGTSAPVDTPPVQYPPVETPPVQNTPVETSPVQNPPVETSPVQYPPVETPPVETPPMETPPVETAPVENPPVENPPVENPPVETAPVEDPPVENPPVETPPVENPPVETPPVKTPVETPPVQYPPVETAPVETAPVETAPVETAPVETAPVETAPVETAPVETAPVETAPVETPPVETPPVEAPVEKPPMETDCTTTTTPAPTSKPTQTTPPANKPTQTTPPTYKPPTSGGSCTEGEIICDSENTFSICSHGAPVFMGKTASGTKCTGGKIVKRAPIRFSPEHMAARKL